MAALRWILLLVGIAFLVVLATWEMRRSRHARDGNAGPEHEEPELGHLPDEFPSKPRPMGAAALSGRTRTMVPPLVELPPLAQPEPLPDEDEDEDEDVDAEARAGESAAMFVDTPPLMPQYETVSGASEPATSQSDPSASESTAEPRAADPEAPPLQSSEAVLVDW